jgi:hypothetical protein
LKYDDLTFSFALSYGADAPGFAPPLADGGRHLEEGMLANIDAVGRLFPGAEVVVHHDGTVDPATLPGARCVRHRPVVRGFLFWRFSGAGTLPAVCVRDADSLVAEREKEAVDEWLDSPCLLHAMHDHPCHAARPVMGGMWGAKRGAFPMHFDRLLNWWLRNESPFSYDDDQQFLARYVEPWVASSRGMRHAGVRVRFLPVRRMPGGESPRTGFVGEKVFRLDRSLRKS